MDEVGDARPGGAVKLRPGHGLPVEPPLLLVPEGVEGLGGEGGLLAGLEASLLKEGVHHLAEEGVYGVLHPLREEEGLFLPGKPLQEEVVQEDLGEDAGGLGEGRGGPEVEEALLAGEVEVHPVPELVGEGVGAVQVVRVVEEDVGVGGGKPPEQKAPPRLPGLG